MVLLLTTLLIVGLCLLCIEMFMPGFGIFGISGIVILIVSSILTLLYVPYGLFIIAAELVIVLVILYFILKYIKKNGLNGKLILTENLATEKINPKDFQSLYGKEGITTSALRPYGSAIIDGNMVEVSTVDGYIPEKTRVIVIDVYNEKIVVEALSQQSPQQRQQ